MGFNSGFKGLSYATSRFEIHLISNPQEKLTVVQVVKTKKPPANTGSTRCTTMHWQYIQPVSGLCHKQMNPLLCITWSFPLTTLLPLTPNHPYGIYESAFPIAVLHIFIVSPIHATFPTQSSPVTPWVKTVNTTSRVVNKLGKTLIELRFEWRARTVISV